MSEAAQSQALREVSLASQSPRRKELLEGLGLRVVVLPSGYIEAPMDDATRGPAEIALLHALGKARQAAANGPAVLIAADTVVDVDGEILGKPADAKDAAAMLRKLSGREHRVYTGFAVIDRLSGQRQSGVESTAVRFVQLSDAEIDAYVSTGDPLDKAGAYGIQGRGGMLVSSISGDFYTVMGLPLARIGAALRELGYDVWAR
ncbi:MAG: Maf family protein [Candidatus Eremiobacteraeota bacterium]|nr:Maf family protein [Candidatus Eremiobacteraeota bacterium]